MSPPGRAEQVDDIPNSMTKELISISVGLKEQMKKRKSARITIVGVGRVGMGITFSLLLQDIASEIVLIDIDNKRLKANYHDLLNLVGMNSTTTITACTDYSKTQNSMICIVATGCRIGHPSTTQDRLQKNMASFKHIIPNLVHFSPKACLLIMSTPVDTMTYIASRLCKISRNRVFGCGTCSDSKRFQTIVANNLGISSKNVTAQIIGERGDKCVPLWSCASVNGLNLQQYDPRFGANTEFWKEVINEILDGNREVNSVYGNSSVAVPTVICDICKSILHHERRVFTVSTSLKDIYDIQEDVCLSMPCIIGEFGISKVFTPRLSEDEMHRINSSVNRQKDIQKSIKL